MKNQTITATFAEDYNSKLSIKALCKDCGAHLEATTLPDKMVACGLRIKGSAWAEAKDLVVIPVFCPDCNSVYSIHVSLVL